MLIQDTSYEAYSIFAKEKFLSDHPYAKMLFYVLDYYQSDYRLKLNFFSFNQSELKRFVLWFFLDQSPKIRTARKYIRLLKEFLKEYYNVDLKLRITDISEKICVLTPEELLQIRMSNIVGYINKLTDLLEFMVASGCEYGKFDVVIPKPTWKQIDNYFDCSEAWCFRNKYKGKMPVIPKRVFDAGVRKLLKSLNINRRVKIDGKIMPIYDMNIDLLINNTFIYEASHRKLTQNMLCEMFEYDDLSRFFPAVSCINDQFIEVKHSEITAIDGLFRLILMNKYSYLRPDLNKLMPAGSNLLRHYRLNFKSVKKPGATGTSSELRRFEIFPQKNVATKNDLFLESEYMESQGYNFSERILTDYMTIMNSYGKKDLN